MQDNEAEENDSKRMREEQISVDIPLPDQPSIPAFTSAKWLKVPEETFAQGSTLPLHNKIAKLAKRWAHTATIINKSIYLYGGCGEDNISFKDITRLSLETWELSLLKDSTLHPSPRDSHVAFAHKNKLYIFGGSSASIKLNDLWEFDIERKVWREVRALGAAPANREAHSAAVVDENFALIFGGKSSVKRLGDAHLLSLGCGAVLKTSAASWSSCTQLGQQPCARDGHCMCSVGNKVYLFGGENDKRQMLNDLYAGIVDPDTCTLRWKKCEQRNAPRARRAATLCCYADEYLVLVGGEGYEETFTTTFNDVWIYSVAAEVWEELFSMLRINTGDWFSPRAYHSAVAVEDCFCVFGGIYEPSKALDDLYVLTLSGEIPKSFERIQNIGMLDVKEERTNASTLGKPQFFAQYIQDRPFTKPAVEEPSAGKSCGVVTSFGVACGFLGDAANGWSIGAFGEIFNVVEDLTGAKSFSIRFREGKAEESKEGAEGGDRLDNIEIAAEGVIVSTDSFKDILNYFGKREEQRMSPDFALLKHALANIGNTLLLVNKMSESAYIGLISPEYMSLAKTGLYHCPYLRLTNSEGKLSGNADALSMLDSVLKYSHVPFESREDFLEHVQLANDQVTFFISRLRDGIKSHKGDIVYSFDAMKEKLLDFSLKNYLKYWNLIHTLKIVVDDCENKEENPYVKIEKYIEEKKVGKYYRKVDNLFDKSVGGSLFLFHKKLMAESSFVSPEELNGVLLYFNNMLELRLAGPRLGDYTAVSRKLVKSKASSKTLFDWGGYVKFTKGSKEEVMNASFLCSLERKMEEVMREIAEEIA